MSSSASLASPPFGDLDPAAFRRGLDRAAGTFDQAALLAHEVEGRLLERLAVMRVEPSRLLVADARTGSEDRGLARRFPKAARFLTDPSVAMLREARRGWSRRRHVCAAWSSALPFPRGAFDLVWSNLGLQWAMDPEPTLREIHRVLGPEGLLLFASLGPDTLAELREALPAAYREPPSLPVFLDMHDVGDVLTRAGFDGVVMEAETITVTYPDLRTLLEDARATGSGAALRDRARGLLTPRRWRALEAALPREEGRIPARFEVVFGHAWRPERAGAAADQGGVARIGVDQIGRRSRPEAR